MNDKKKPTDFKKVDTKEFELPETVFIRDIDNKVFQGIVLESLNQIEDVSLLESNFIDNIFGRSTTENTRGIQAEQDSKNNSINIKLEVNILYGVPIPEKAEEIQTKVAEEITRITGLHVSSVHVVFKNIVSKEAIKKGNYPPNHPINYSTPPEDYTDEF